MEWRIREHFPEISDEVMGNLRIFHIELLRFNQKLNLVSNYTDKNADLLHFYDSIKASEFIVKDNPALTEIYDFGSGNGLPGIVFALLYPNITVNLVEADQRKSEFLQHIIARTEIKNINLMNIKADDINLTDPAIIMTRGMANLARTLLLGNKIFQIGSIVYSLKGADWFSELTALPSQISSTWNNEMAIEYELPTGLGPKVVLKSVKIH